MNMRRVSLVLTLLGCLGVGSTAVLSVKCSRKADKAETKKEKLIAYTPAIVSGVATVGCIGGSHFLSSREIIALTTTCGYLASKNLRFEKEIAKELPQEKVNEIKHKIANDHVNAYEASEEVFEKTGWGSIQFFENALGRGCKTSLEHMEWAQKELNTKLHNGEYVCMNDWYELIGLKKTSEGYLFGWPANEDYVDMTLEEPITFMNVYGEDSETGEPMYLVTMSPPPMPYWNEV